MRTRLAEAVQGGVGVGVGVARIVFVESGRLDCLLVWYFCWIQLKWMSCLRVVCWAIFRVVACGSLSL